MRHRVLQVVALLAPVCACSPTQVRYEPSIIPAPEASTVEAVVYLIGDAGEVSSGRDAVLAHLARDLTARAGSRSGLPVTVVFLGDNIYDEGLPTEPTEEDLEKLTGQVEALGNLPNVRAVFLPGNHDWANGGSLLDGRQAISRQTEWVERVLPGRDIRFQPDDGCPGPATQDIGESVHLVYIDTEWLLRKPERRCGTADAFYARLTADLRENRDRPVVILSHHPLVSGGPHGGNVAPFQNGPLVYYLARKSGAGVQDLSSGRYTEMVRRLKQAVAASGVRPLAYAAGHDHTLQVIGMTGPGTPLFQLVSGAGSKSERSRRIPGMRYATEGYGYMRLDFTTNGAYLTVFEGGVRGAEVRPVFTCQLSTNGADSCPEATRVHP